MGKTAIMRMVKESVEFMENFEKDNKEFSSKFQEKDQLETELRSKLDGELGEMFDEYIHVAYILEAMAVDDAYGEGIRYGIQIMHEALD